MQSKFTLTTKRCSKCLLEKVFTDFNKCFRASGGIHNHCRDCQREVRKNWYTKNRDQEIEKNKKYQQSDKAKLVRKLRWKKTKHVIGPINNARRRTTTARIKANIKRKAWLQIPHNRIACNLRVRIRKALKGISKSLDTEQLIGCSFEQLKVQLEKKFVDGMDWSNYGEWHIDHIKPCANFDLTNVSQQRLCFHYTNLQPLWRTDNQSKGCKNLF